VASVHSTGHQFVIDFKAYKERLLEEMFDVYSARDKRKIVSFVFHARVLGLSASGYPLTVRSF